jgi:hypothetical protein
VTQRLTAGTSLSLPSLDDYPITTVYLQYASEVALEKPMYGLSGTLSQWIFDRGEQQPGLLAVVISGPGCHEKMTKAELTQHVAIELAQHFKHIDAQPVDSLVIKEKRATFAAEVDIQSQRLHPQTAISGLWLAGDAILNAYPATLEGAVINGHHVAEQIINASR